MYLLRLSLKSLANRRFSAWLTVFAIALSVALLLGVERIRSEARTSFASTISGTDLIVGARSGSVQLLLYSVFRIGNATNNIRWDSYQAIADHPRVDWAIPLALGDSHRGYKVLGTSPEYFDHFRYGRAQPLELTDGRRFEDLYEAVLGADVARNLGYRAGDEIVLAHGTGSVSFVEHADKPFRVSGVLARTGTPVDRTVHISLEGMQAIHLGWNGGVPARGASAVTAEEARQRDLTPQSITAVLLGLDSRIATFTVQRDINQFRGEPLLAILPGVALQELWSLLGTAEKALLLVSACVVLTGLIGMLTAVLAGLNERRREMAILRSVGARPGHIFGLLLSEAMALTLAGIVCGLAILYLALGLSRPWLLDQYGLFIAIAPPSAQEWLLLGAILAASMLMGCIPAWRAYRQSLSDGLTIRV